MAFLNYQIQNDGALRGRRLVGHVGAIQTTALATAPSPAAPSATAPAASLHHAHPTGDVAECLHSSRRCADGHVLLVHHTLRPTGSSLLGASEQRPNELPHQRSLLRARPVLQRLVHLLSAVRPSLCGVADRHADPGSTATDLLRSLLSACRSGFPTQTFIHWCLGWQVHRGWRHRVGASAVAPREWWRRGRPKGESDDGCAEAPRQAIRGRRVPLRCRAGQCRELLARGRHRCGGGAPRPRAEPLHH